MAPPNPSLSPLRYERGAVFIDYVLFGQMMRHPRVIAVPCPKVRQIQYLVGNLPIFAQTSLDCPSC